MSIESDSEVRSDGSTSTIQVTVSDPGSTGQGGRRARRRSQTFDLVIQVDPRHVAYRQHLTCLRVKQGAPIDMRRHQRLFDPTALFGYWEEIELPPDESLELTLVVDNLGGPEHIGCTHVRVLIVSAALKRSYFALHTLCNDGSGKLLQARGDRNELVPRSASRPTGRSASPGSGRRTRRKP